MAISPIVNSFMQQGEQSDSPQDAEQLFKNQFSDLAYNALRAKFPKLINYVVTLKTMAHGLTEGSAFGVFIIGSGEGVVYVPVAMSDGSITSCEMAYDKKTDQFFPLDKNTVREIVAKNQSTEPTLLTNNPRIEDTRALFHNMVRPPSSSNVVLAANRGGIADLPDNCKEIMSRYLTEEKPELLGKIASFYNVEELAFKLSPKPLEKTACDDAILPEFLRLDTLTKEAASLLSDSDKKQILDKGWVITKKTSEEPVIVTPKDKLKKAFETELRLTVYSPSYANQYVPVKDHDKTPVYSGKLLLSGDSELSFKPVLICDNILFYDGKFMRLYSNDTVLVQDLSSEKVDISGFSKLVALIALNSAVNHGEPHSWKNIVAITPGQNGTWVYCDDLLHGSANDFSVVDNQAKFSSGRNTIRVQEGITRGYLRLGDGNYVFPKESRFAVLDSDSKPLPVVANYDQLLRMAQVFGFDLSVADAAPGVSITDSRTEKTASFATRTDAAGYLFSNYNLTDSQIDRVLDNKRSVIFEKSAFMDPTPEDIAMVQAGQAPAAPMESAMMGEMQQDVPPPNFEDLDDFAELEDPEMFDVGILSAFSQKPDIKSMLVEYLPDFLAAEDKIGRILLLFSSQKKEIEDFYGPEKSQTVLASCRRIFSILGEIVASLKLYINMG